MSINDPTALVTTDASASVELAPYRTQWQIFSKRFRKDRAATIGLIAIGVLILLALLAPMFAAIVNHTPSATFPNTMLNDYGVPKGPNAQFWLGADRNARDLFIRILYGTQVSLLVAVAATGLSMIIGVTLGTLAGYYRGWVDTILGRTMDVMLAFPLLLLAIGLGQACAVGGCFGGTVKPGLGLVIMIIAFANWPYIARIVRGQVLSLREKEFVEAARSLGMRDRRIIAREILPNLLAPIIVYATLAIPGNILFEAALSFLGVGVNPPQASLGQMIGDAASSGAFTFAWWYMLFPGVFLLSTVLAFNLVGDAMRDALDSRASRA